jgi:hypothetical protein
VDVLLVDTDQLHVVVAAEGKRGQPDAFKYSMGRLRPALQSAPKYVGASGKNVDAESLAKFIPGNPPPIRLLAHGLKLMVPRAQWLLETKIVPPNDTPAAREERAALWAQPLPPMVEDNGYALPGGSNFQVNTAENYDDDYSDHSSRGDNDDNHDSGGNRNNNNDDDDDNYDDAGIIGGGSTDEDEAVDDNTVEPHRPSKGSPIHPSSNGHAGSGSSSGSGTGAKVAQDTDVIDALRIKSSTSPGPDDGNGNDDDDDDDDDVQALGEFGPTRTSPLPMEDGSGSGSPQEVNTPFCSVLAVYVQTELVPYLVEN